MKMNKRPYLYARLGGEGGMVFRLLKEGGKYIYFLDNGGWAFGIKEKLDGPFLAKSLNEHTKHIDSLVLTEATREEYLLSATQYTYREAVERQELTVIQYLRQDFPN